MSKQVPVTTLIDERRLMAIKIINAFDGVKNTAIHCGLAASTVSDWKAKGIPRSWSKYFQTIRPELFKSVEQNK